MSATVVVNGTGAALPKKKLLQMDGFTEGTRRADLALIDKCIAKHASSLLTGERGRVIIEMLEGPAKNDKPLRMSFEPWDELAFKRAAKSETAKELGSAIAKFDPRSSCVVSVSTPNIDGRRTYVLSLPRNAKNSTAQELASKL